MTLYITKTTPPPAVSMHCALSGLIFSIDHTAKNKNNCQLYLLKIEEKNDIQKARLLML